MKIAEYDLEGNFLESHEVSNIAELEEKLKAPRGSIGSCLRGRTLSTINRQFKEHKSHILTRIGDVSDCKKMPRTPVSKFYKGRYICTYETTTIASKKNNIDAESITKCCMGKYKTAGGFSWKYPQAAINAL